eukprot:6121937-Pleurochrysis_carterae.AAC.2
MYGRLRGDAEPAVKLRGMMTGPRRSQTHPRAVGTKQACPRTKGCGRARLSDDSRIVVSLGGGRGSVRGGAMRGVKGRRASAGAERSGAGVSSNASSRTRSLKSHAPTLSTQKRR